MIKLLLNTVTHKIWLKWKIFKSGNLGLKNSKHYLQKLILQISFLTIVFVLDRLNKTFLGKVQSYFLVLYLIFVN